MKMKTSDAIILAQAIGMAQMSGKFAPPKFGFALAINATALKSVTEAYDASRIALAKEHAAKDDMGEPVMIEENGSSRFEIPDMAAFNAALKTVQDAEVEVSLMKISLDDFPQEIDPGLVMGLLPIVKAPGADKAAA